MECEGGGGEDAGGDACVRRGRRYGIYSIATALFQSHLHTKQIQNTHNSYMLRFLFRYIPLIIPLISSPSFHYTSHLSETTISYHTPILSTSYPIPSHPIPCNSPSTVKHQTPIPHVYPLFPLSLFPSPPPPLILILPRPQAPGPQSLTHTPSAST